LQPECILLIISTIQIELWWKSWEWWIFRVKRKGGGVERIY